MSLSVNNLIGSGAGGQLPIFAGGAIVYTDLYTLCRSMAKSVEQATPTAGGALTLNGETVGNYDYTVKDGNITISSYSNGTWFTTTADTVSAFCVVKGNLTIDSGQILIPTNRKLFTVVYVGGDLSITGGISMEDRGANHSGGISGADIRIINGTKGGVANPEIPAAGAAGGDVGGQGSEAGADGTAGQTGGGGSGAANGTGGNDGNGAAGTSFVGGAGGGGLRNTGGAEDGNPGVADGGAGGAGKSDVGGTGAGGGAGNPGGAGADGGATGDTGIGGVLVVICEGTFSGAGTIVASGSDGGDGINTPDDDGGGGSGGGSVTVLYGTDSSSITPTALGGSGGVATVTGGDGGDGTARKLAL